MSVNLKQMFTNIVETHNVDQLKQDILKIGVNNLDSVLMQMAEKYSRGDVLFLNEMSWFVLVHVLNIFNSWCEINIVKHDLIEYSRTKSLYSNYKIISNEELDLLDSYEKKYENILTNNHQNFGDYYWWTGTQTKMFVHLLNEKSKFVRELFAIGTRWYYRRLDGKKKVRSKENQRAAII